MKEKKVDRLRMLLRQVEMPEPQKEFTEEVMREAAYLGEERVSVDVRLKRVLQGGGLTEPPANFIYKVQQGIRQPNSHIAKPVITRGIWITVGLFLAACMVVALTFPTENTKTGTYLYFAWLANHVVSWTSSFRETLLYFEVIALAAGALLGLDSMLRRRAGLSKHINS